MGLRSVRTDVDVGRREGESCVGMGERLEMRGAVQGTWKQGGRTISGRGVMLRKERGFARTWSKRMRRVVKHLVNRNRDVVGANCVKVSDGKIVMEEDRLMEV